MSTRITGAAVRLAIIILALAGLIISVGHANNNADAVAPTVGDTFFIDGPLAVGPDSGKRAYGDDFGDEYMLQAWYRKSRTWRQRTCDLYQTDGWRASKRTHARMDRMLGLRHWDRAERTGAVAYAIAFILPEC